MAMQTQEKNRLQAPDNKHIQENIKISLQNLKALIEDIETQIDTIFEHNEVLKKKVEIATEIPGIGKTTAKALISRTRHPRQAKDRQPYWPCSAS